MSVANLTLTINRDFPSLQANNQAAAVEGGFSITTKEDLPDPGASKYLIGVGKKESHSGLIRLLSTVSKNALL